MKKIISFALILTLIFSLSACGKKKNSDIEVVKDYESQPVSGDSEGGQKVAVNNIDNAFDFKNGCSWVRYSNGTMYLVNTKGNILYASEHRHGGGDMCDDACFVKEEISEGNYVYKIINKNGNVVASSADGKFDEILAAGDNLFFVHKYDGGIDRSRNLYGTINEKGEFVNQLRECPFRDAKFSVAKYIGSNSFLFGDEVSYYNACIYMSTCDKFFAYGHRGYAVEGVGSDLYIYDNRGIMAEGSEKEYSKSDEGYEYVVVRSDGKIEKAPKFSYIANGLLVTNDEENKSVSFTDPATGKTFNFSKYYISSAEAADDKLLVHINGADQKNYCTILDKTGNMLFEHVMGTGAEASDNRLVLSTDEGYSVLDYTGKVIIPAGTYSYIGSFNSGIAWAKNSSDQYVGIDVNGKVVIS